MYFHSLYHQVDISQTWPYQKSTYQQHKNCTKMVNFIWTLGNMFSNMIYFVGECNKYSKIYFKRMLGLCDFGEKINSRHNLIFLLENCLLNVPPMDPKFSHIVQMPGGRYNSRRSIWKHNCRSGECLGNWTDPGSNEQLKSAVRIYIYLYNINE